MSDRLKFRAWDKKLNKYWTGEMIEESDEIIYFISYGKIGFALEDPNWRELKPIQSTGLKDKRGKLIFEGDIVQKRDCYDGENGYTNIAIVVFDHDGFCLKKISGSPKSEAGGLYGFPSKVNMLEIIGNIYENPELLKGPTNDE